MRAVCLLVSAGLTISAPAEYPYQGERGMVMRALEALLRSGDAVSRGVSCSRIQEKEEKP